MSRPRPSLAPYSRFPVQELLRRTAARLPEKAAVIDDERRFTFRQLEEYSGRLAGALASFGVRRDEHVALLAPNCAEFVIAFFGILKAGAIVTTINSAYREREIAHQLNDSGAEVVIVHADLEPVLESAREEAPGLRRVVPIEPAALPGSFWDAIDRAPATPRLPLARPDDVAALPYSSGTTGLSKGVMLTHANLVSNVEQMVGREGEESVPREDDVILVHLPLFHIYGMNVLMNPAVAVGATQVMMGRFDMDRFLNLISRRRVTQLFTVPPVGLGVTQYAGVSNHDLTSLRVGFFGAAPMSAELQLRVEEALGCTIIQGYGMTETSPLANSDFLEPERIRRGSVGPAAPDTEERVVDVETGTKVLPVGEVGELMIRGPQVMRGYYDNAGATAETLTEDGWLHTGDIARMDADGYVWFSTGRRS